MREKSQQCDSSPSLLDVVRERFLSFSVRAKDAVKRFFSNLKVVKALTVLLGASLIALILTAFWGGAPKGKEIEILFLMESFLVANFLPKRFEKIQRWADFVLGLSFSIVIL